MEAKEIVDALLRLGEILATWPIIILFIIFYFRNEIKSYLPILIKRLRTVEIFGIKGELTEPKTLMTVLGKAEISTVPVISGFAIFEGYIGTYISKRYNFQISWPIENWSSKDKDIIQTTFQKIDFKLPPNTEIPVLITRNEYVGDVQPNVNVLVTPIGAMHISQYMDLTKEAMQQQKWEIYDVEIDEKTNGGFIVVFNSTFNTYQFARFAIAYGLAYQVTATQLPPDDQIGQQVRDELMSILNSFRIII